MNIVRSLTSAMVLSVGFTLTSTGVAEKAKPEFLQKYESQGFPTQSRATKFDGASSLPLPRQTKPVESTAIVKPEPLSDQEKKAFATARQALRNSEELNAKLGPESRLLSAGELPKPKSDAGTAPNQYKFTFYNYQKDQAIEAYVSNDKVTKIKERELGYQPTVSQGELQEAAKIAGQKSSGIGKIGQDSLRGLAQSGPDGRRQIRLFGDKPDAATAVVDLYEKKVLEVK